MGLFRYRGRSGRDKLGHSAPVIAVETAADRNALKQAVLALLGIVTKAAAKRAAVERIAVTPTPVARNRGRPPKAPPGSALDANEPALTAEAAAPSRSRRGRPLMTTFAGLDVSLKTTALCLVDEEGKIVLETEVASEPDAIADALRPYGASLRKVGPEAGALSPWLQTELLARGVPAVVLEARHARAALKAQRNKTDKTDARGLAQIVRTG